MQSIQDRSAPSISGFMMLGIGIALLFFTGVAMPILSAIGMVVGFFILTGFTVIQPNTAAVITFFGDYKGTLKDSGFRFTIPFSNKRKVPLKLINFITDRLKVNDLNGNPIEIGAVVVWRVADAAQAVFNVDDYRAFVTNQSDIAIRTIAAHYPYDSDKEMSLRGNIDEIAGKLKEALQAKLGMAGIIIEETKLSHLAYAPEVAAAMLKRQQAVAVFQARQYMVENTLAIIDEVIDHFQTKSNVKISDDKKADLINSLLVTMTSDKESHPVINLGK